MSRVGVLVAVAVAAGMLAGCSSEPEVETAYPFADYDAQAWFNENYEESSCPFPDKPETACSTVTDVRVKPVTLPAGTVLDQSRFISPGDSTPPEPEFVTLEVDQTVWCFVVRYYDRSLDWMDRGQERIRYDYPCWSLGGNPNDLNYLAGYLLPDGSVGKSYEQECRRQFPGDLMDEDYRACMDGAEDSTVEPDW